MIDITDKTVLEGVFAEDFSSPYYPILANLYLQEGDLRRAKKVCEVGLDHGSANTDGKFILAKVALAEDKLTIAEKWLKQVVNENSAQFRALRLLIKIEFQLDRSTNTIQDYISLLLNFLPNDKEGQDWLIKLQSVNSNEPGDKVEQPLNEEAEDKSSNETSRANLEAIVEEPYEVEVSMATFTMVQVLKSQKYFNQAMAVLNILESKGEDSDRISKEKTALHALIAESRDNPAA